MELTLFDHFPEPVFYIQSEKLQYSNPAALALAPDWTAGCAVPEALAVQPDTEGVFSCVIGERAFQASATRTEDGTLLVLRNAVPIPEDALMTFLPVQLREMTNNLQNAAQELARLTGDGDEKVRNNLSVIGQSFYRLLRLARQMELAEQVREGKPLPGMERSVDLAELCRETTYGALKLAEQAGVTFRAEVPGGLLVSAGDRELLEIMLLELLSNALKAAGVGGEAGLRLCSTGKKVLITVWDTGAGMSQAELSAMTDGTSRDSLPKPGTGLRLGLSIARLAATAHGGTLLLEPREGQGLRVTVSLPLRKPAKGKVQGRVQVEESFSSLLTMLSDALPWHVFEE